MNDDDNGNEDVLVPMVGSGGSLESGGRFCVAGFWQGFGFSRHDVLTFYILSMRFAKIILQ